MTSRILAYRCLDPSTTSLRIEIDLSASLSSNAISLLKVNHMQFTFYAYIGPNHRRHPITTLSTMPNDWLHIKQLVQEAGFILWNDRHESEAILSLEKHLSGPYTMKWQKAGYARKRLYFKRNIEFSCKFQFNPRSYAVSMSNVQFGPALMFSGCLEDYRRIEKSLWKLPPSPIPKTHENMLGNTKSLLMEPSASRNADYSRVARLIYREGAERQMKWQSYDKVVSRRYMPKSLQLLEEHEENSEGEET
jgi:hypothetical protein